MGVTKPIHVDEVRIALVFGRWMRFGKRFITWEAYNVWNKDIGVELEKATVGGSWGWKSAFTKTFSFEETDQAEKLATAIIHYHAARPNVLINHLKKIVTVSSPGYQA